MTQIRLPTDTLKTESRGLCSLEKPLKGYTHENIKLAIWVTLWIAMYHHNFKNERIHIVELLNTMAKGKFTTKHKKLIKEYLSETISQLNGDTVDLYQNLLYFYHHAYTYIGIKVNYKDFNKLFLLSKQLDLGRSYYVNEGKRVKKITSFRCSKARCA